MTLAARQYRSLAVLALLFLLGVALVVAGEADDSPGLGGIGLLVAAAAVWRAALVVRRRS